MLAPKLRCSAAIKHRLCITKLPLQGHGRKLVMLPVPANIQQAWVVHQHHLEDVGRPSQRPKSSVSTGALCSWMLREMQQIHCHMRHLARNDIPRIAQGDGEPQVRLHPAPRSSHRRGSAFSLLGGFPPVSEEETELEAAGSEASGYGSSTAPTKSQCSRTSSSSTSASSVASSHYEELDRGLVGVAAGQRKHRSSGSSGKGHVGKKHKTRAC
ncbi:conserved hypothetical protein [Verticillium alfalfae VaMs.102]|uniref:Uncharacterized protein n=1 Tax=Verticillium alfalfae (strain VaMs.102 / ATCC MYA-4576 / FGSC 10136) TaxID=526221 RepID=C9SVY8_VERA1|nr:conserved hypothetical protein [Verticillium alfalfae VaMs.102]EEY22953.1 conserved hypothetical protein [Verticillium alfalfae VaMs.102]